MFRSDELVVSAFVDKLADIYRSKVTLEAEQANFDMNELKEKPYKKEIDLGFTCFFLFADLASGTNIAAYKTMLDLFKTHVVDKAVDYYNKNKKEKINLDNQ